MKALVTGGGGFLGRAIVRELLGKDYSIRVLGRRDYPDLKNIGVECHRGDIANLNDVEKSCDGVDLVFHAAAIPGIWGKWDTFYQANYIGSKNVLRCCQKRGVPRLIYTSSPSVVFNGQNMENIDETIPYPQSYNNYYPQTKAMAERLILNENGNNGTLTCALRPHLIWGPGDNHLIPRFLERGKAGLIKQVGDGQNLVDTIYIDNAASAHILAADSLTADSKVAGQAYFISQDKPIKLWHWINQFLQAAELPPVSRTVPAAVARFAGTVLEGLYTILPLKGEPRMTRFLADELSKSHWYDISRAKSDFNYDVAISTDEGFRRTFDSDYFRGLVKKIHENRDI